MCACIERKTLYHQLPFHFFFLLLAFSELILGDAQVDVEVLEAAIDTRDLVFQLLFFGNRSHVLAHLLKLTKVLVTFALQRCFFDISNGLTNYRRREGGYS